MPIPIALSDSRPGNDNYTVFLPPEPVVYEVWMPLTGSSDI